nr:hypothetical protein [Nitzschia traheaformis]
MMYFANLSIKDWSATKLENFFQLVLSLHYNTISLTLYCTIKRCFVALLTTMALLIIGMMLKPFTIIMVCTVPRWQSLIKLRVKFPKFFKNMGQSLPFEITIIKLLRRMVFCLTPNLRKTWKVLTSHFLT